MIALNTSQEIIVINMMHIWEMHGVIRYSYIHHYIQVMLLSW